MAIEIRRATRDDLPALHRLYDQLESTAANPTMERLTEVFERLARYPDYGVYLAVDDGEPVGTFALCILDTLGDRCAPEGIVEDVVVAPLARGRGIGKQMMAFALESCRAAGCYKMALSSNLARQDAHRFYESLGFERHGYSFLVRIEPDR